MKPSRKMEKILMGHGIQRNDARAFLKVRRMLKEKKVLIPALAVEELPEPPVIRGPELRPVTFRAAHTISRASYELAKEHAKSGSVAVDTKVNNALMEEMKRSMLFNRAIQLRKEVTQDQISYLAEVTVLLPENKKS